MHYFVTLPHSSWNYNPECLFSAWCHADFQNKYLSLLVPSDLPADDVLSPSLFTYNTRHSKCLHILHMFTLTIDLYKISLACYGAQLWNYLPQKISPTTLLEMASHLKTASVQTTWLHIHLLVPLHLL